MTSKVVFTHSRVPFTHGKGWTELAKVTEVLRSQRSGVASDRENLRINLGKAQRELQIAETAIAALILKAPRDGIVVLRDHPWEGRKLQEGDGVWVGFPLVQIPEMASLQVEASLPDVDDGKIATGMTASATFSKRPVVPSSTSSKLSATGMTARRRR